MATCGSCGCTDERACPGGCSWFKKGLCTTCREDQVERLVYEATAWAAHRVDGETVSAIAGRRCTVTMSRSDGVSVVDHLGVTIFEVGPDGYYVAPQYDVDEIMPLFTVNEASRAA
jgi:hypothetical protein